MIIRVLLCFLQDKKNEHDSDNIKNSTKAYGARQTDQHMKHCRKIPVYD